MDEKRKYVLTAAAVTASCIPATLLFQLIRLPAETQDIVRVLIYAVSYAVIAAPVLIYCIAKKIRPEALGLLSTHTVRDMIIGAAFAAAIALAGPFVLRALFGADAGSSAGVSYAVVFFVAAFAEEFMFRGFLQRRICDSLGKAPGLFISSAVFVLFHLPRYAMSGAAAGDIALNCAAVFCGALIFGGLALVFDDIWPSVFVHAAANFVLAAI